MQQRRHRTGLTLIEIMAVLLIIGLMAGLAARNFMGQTDRARVVRTKADLKTLHGAVNLFRLDTGRYPSEEMGLIELIEEPTDVTGWEPGGYLETTQVPRDAWGNDYIYMLNPGTGRPFVILSYGADAREGGEGYDADLYSTDID